MPEIFQFAFMNRALLAGAVVGFVCPVIGLFLVLRRLSLLGDTLAHVALAGVAASMLLQIYPLSAALALTLGAAVAIEKLREVYRDRGELAVAVTLSSAVGLAVVLLNLGRSMGAERMAFLFGSVVAVSGQDVLAVAVLGALVLAVVALLSKELFFLAFDEELARVAGLPVRGLNLLFAALAAVTVALTMRMVGALLVSALLVLPAAAALPLAGSFRSALALAVGFGEVAVLGGLVAAYYLDLAPGGTVVLAAAALLLAALAARRLRRRCAGPGRKLAGSGDPGAESCLRTQPGRTAGG